MRTAGMAEDFTRDEGPLCPMCPNHCPLSDPSCQRGMAYARQMEERAEADAREADAEGTDAHLRERLIACGQLLARGGDGHNSRKRVLSSLNARGTMTQKALTDLLGLTPGAMSEILGKMEKQGHIAREKSAEDRRVTRVTLTPTGRSELAKMEAVSVDLLEDLTEPEKRQLAESLERIWASWERQRGKNGAGRG